MTKIFEIAPPVAIGADTGKVTACFVSDGEQTQAGRVLAIVETAKEILELRADTSLKVVKTPSKGDPITQRTPVLSFEIDPELAQEGYGYQANQQVFPLTIMNIRRRGSIVEPEDVMAVLHDGNGVEQKCHPRRAGRLIHASAQGQQIQPGQVFCVIQPLGPAQRMGAPKALSYPVTVETVLVEPGVTVEAGNPLCVLVDSDGRRVRISAKRDGIVTLAGIRKGQALDRPGEIFRIRQNVDHIKDNKISWTVRSKTADPPGDRKASSSIPVKPARPRAKDPSALSSERQPTSARAGMLVTLGLLPLVVFGIWSQEDRIVEILLSLRDPETQAVEAQPAGSGSEPAPLQAGVAAGLIDLTTLSNGRTPVPSVAQERALKEFLSP